MKTESKQDLRDRISHLERVNQKLLEERDRDQKERWERRKPEADKSANKALSALFPNLVRNLRYEHVDAAGYWYTFDLANDQRRQTFCVRHDDLT